MAGDAVAILRAAYPGVKYRYRSCAGAYLAGVGVNAIAPARGGDLVKIFLTRTRLEGSTTPTILASLLVETLVDAVLGIVILAYALTQHLIALEIVLRAVARVAHVDRERGQDDAAPHDTVDLAGR